MTMRAGPYMRSRFLFEKNMAANHFAEALLLEKKANELRAAAYAALQRAEFWAKDTDMLGEQEQSR